MIDEYGNEITENRFLSLKEKAYEKRFQIVFFVALFIATLAVIQIFSILNFNNKSQKNNNGNAIPTMFPPKSNKKLSRVATDSGFIGLQNQTASLSAEIEELDLYENSLVFPPVNTKVKIEEK